MPHAPATRPPITTTEMWLAAPMTSSRTPRASATAPTAVPVCVRVAGAARSRHRGSRRGRDRGMRGVPAGHGRGRRGARITGTAIPGAGRTLGLAGRRPRPPDRLAGRHHRLAQLRHGSGTGHAERRGQRGRGGQRGPRRTRGGRRGGCGCCPAAGREAAGPGDGAACGRGRDGDAGAGIPGRESPGPGIPGPGSRAGRGPLLPPGLAGRYWRQGRGRGRLLQGRLQAPVGHPERVAALLQLPGQLVDLRVPQRGQLLPGLGRERGEEVGLGEQQVLGVVQGQPEPGIPGQRDQRQVDDQGGEGVEPAVPVVVQGVLVVRVAVLGGRGLPGQLRNPEPRRSRPGGAARPGPP